MSYALQTCPICKKNFIGPLSVCPYCKYEFPKVDVPSLYVTSISGQTYGPSSATTTYSPSFEELSDEFAKDSEKENAKKTREELLQGKEYLDESQLSLYINSGYLWHDYEGHFRLTDLGKDTYRKNRDFKKKIKEKEESKNGK